MLGLSSLSLQGISVVPGIVDSDYTGEIKVLISLPAKTVQINKGQRIETEERWVIKVNSTAQD